jgi:hypothetical protein
LSDRESVHHVNDWQGPHYCDEFKHWDDNKHDNIGWNAVFDNCKNINNCEPKKCKRKFDGENDYVHWTEDKDIWPHDYSPWDAKGKEQIKKNY